MADPVTERDDWSRWPSFTPAELACKGSGMVRLHPGFMDALQALRNAFGAPLVITSGCRTAAHNQVVGGAMQSFHVCDRRDRGCLAVDVRVGGGATARLIAEEAIKLGWSIGVPKAGFIHLDRRDLIGETPVLFGY